MSFDELNLDITLKDLGDDFDQLDILEVDSNANDGITKAFQDFTVGSQEDELTNKAEKELLDIFNPDTSDKNIGFAEEEEVQHVFVGDNKRDTDKLTTPSKNPSSAHSTPGSSCNKARLTVGAYEEIYQRIEKDKQKKIREITCDASCSFIFNALMLGHLCPFLQDKSSEHSWTLLQEETVSEGFNLPDKALFDNVYSGAVLISSPERLAGPTPEEESHKLALCYWIAALYIKQEVCTAQGRLEEARHYHKRNAKETMDGEEESKHVQGNEEAQLLNMIEHSPQFEAYCLLEVRRGKMRPTARQETQRMLSLTATHFLNCSHALHFLGTVEVKQNRRLNIIPKVSLVSLATTRFVATKGAGSSREFKHFSDSFLKWRMCQTKIC